MKLPLFFVIGAILFLSFSRPAAAGIFDHSSYDAVLRRYVDEKGRVDYDSIRLNSLTALESYFERLADADMAGWPTAERLAFWINAYNARVIYLIAEKPDLKKISDDFEMFDQPFKIAGQKLTLHDIERRMLRGTDPRVHFALVCGAVGSPTLRNAAYTAENLNSNLQTDAAAFANSPQYVDVVDGHLKLSRMLKWYADDFKSVGGVQTYLLSLLTPEEDGDATAVMQRLQKPDEKISFTYDWTVNDQKNFASEKSYYGPPPSEIPRDASETSQTDLSQMK
jgi:hypothetical protein